MTLRDQIAAIIAKHAPCGDTTGVIDTDVSAADEILKLFPSTSLASMPGSFDSTYARLGPVMEAFPDVKVTVLHDTVVFHGKDAAAATGMYLEIKPHIPKLIRAMLERRRYEFKRFRDHYLRNKVGTFHYTEFGIAERIRQYTASIKQIDDFLGTTKDLAVDFSTTKSGRPSWRLKP